MWVSEINIARLNSSLRVLWFISQPTTLPARKGKVQVTASDLYQIAQLLNKPIEYFFGEDYGDTEVQDQITYIRRQPPDIRAQSIETTKFLLLMQQLGDIAKDNPDKEFTFEELQDFFAGFLKFSKQINDLTPQMNAIRDMLIQELKSRGLELPSQ